MTDSEEVSTYSKTSCELAYATGGDIVALKNSRRNVNGDAHIVN